MLLPNTHTIIAHATPVGSGALAIIRLSGKDAIAIVNTLFVSKDISKVASHTLHVGELRADNILLDEVVVSIFKNPRSYTGEDVVEISCHGSNYIIQQILQACIQLGAVLAKPGEFTQRAFLYNKLDLSQAEAVADIISAENKSQHTLAFKQMRGGYSEKIKELRQELIDFAALLELELDFSEEDVEFADREKFLSLVKHTLSVLEHLIRSFEMGNVLKKGIPIAIIGKPNVGKSTLLNTLLQEEKAMVSEVAGTTRDFIEDVLQIHGITYRFIDTAGIRNTEDTLENMGIKRAYEKIKTADIVLYVATISEDYKTIVDDFNAMKLDTNQKIIIVLNKADTISNICNAYDIEEAVCTLTKKQTVAIAAHTNTNIDTLITLIEKNAGVEGYQNEFVVTNARHIESLQKAKESLLLVQQGLLDKISGEFISIDVRTGLDALGTITGQISNEDILSSVFSRFCIGK